MGSLLSLILSFNTGQLRAHLRQRPSCQLQSCSHQSSAIFLSKEPSRARQVEHGNAYNREYRIWITLCLYWAGWKVRILRMNWQAYKRQWWGISHETEMSNSLTFWIASTVVRLRPRFGSTFQGTRISQQWSCLQVQPVERREYNYYNPVKE
jgi:hypothetical protein